MKVIEPPVQPRPEFAEELWDRLVAQLERPPRRMTVRVVLVAAALLLLLAGVASATYLGVRLLASQPTTRPAQLTAISGHTIVALTPSGPRVVWHCPRPVFCGDLESIDWTRDGRHLAFTLGWVGGRSAYVGLHIIDVRTGLDLHLPRMRLAQPLSPIQPKAVMQRVVKAMIAQLGCLPTDVAWSPNGRRLAYGCASNFYSQTHEPGVLFTITAAGRDRRTIRTATDAAFSPSWSPDGSRIVFASGSSPTQVVALGPTVTRHSSVYLVGTDGRGRRLLARNAAAPSWSPTGLAIAYETVNGVRLVTPGGRDVTPPAGLPTGIPSWSRDGSQLAIGTAHGMVVYDTRTWQAQHLTRSPVGGVMGLGRPAWYPAPFVPPVRSPQGGHQCALCF